MLLRINKALLKVAAVIGGGGPPPYSPSLDFSDARNSMYL